MTDPIQQEAIGNIADNPKLQAEGKAKQVKGQVQHLIEKARSGVRRILQ